MTREEVFAAWAPAGGAWFLWVRPVLFAQMPEGEAKAGPDDRAGPEAVPPAPGWCPPADGATLLVLDLPGAESVRLGLSLVRAGYRPVPLFNACTGPQEVVEQGWIQKALRDGAGYLRAQALPPGAPPAFLLDELRQTPARPLQPGAFDNRWRVYPEDFPSEEVLQARGLRRLLLIQRGRRRPQEDLARVLWYWQESGLAIAVKDPLDDTPPRPLVVSRPNWARRLWERLLRYFGVRRGAPDGFGYVIPEPTQG
jgi:hypothetical protein